MKKIYFILMILVVALWSCYDDKGNYDYKLLPNISIEGFETSYVCDPLDILKIKPTVNNDKGNNFEYLWMCYDKNDFRKKIDTLSKNKDLDYKVRLPLSTYNLIFSIKDKGTNVTKYFYSNLVVKSKYSSGWFVLKEEDGNTDLDFFNNGVVSSNLLSSANGEALSGHPIALDFCKEFSWLDIEEEKMVDNVQSLVVMSNNNLRIVRLSDMQYLSDFSSLFFDEAPQKKLEGWFWGSEESGMINDGKLYSYSARNGQLGVSKFSFPKDGEYRLSPVFTKNATLYPLLFDKESGKFCTSARSNLGILYLEDNSFSSVPNLFKDVELLYAGFLDEGMWEGGKGYVVIQKVNGLKSILYFDLNCLVSYDDMYLKNTIYKKVDLPVDAIFNNAQCFAMSRKFKQLYFSVRDKLYYYDLENNKEFEVRREDGTDAVENGENIVMMKHVVFDYSDWQDETIKEYVEALVVATKIGDNYKIYLLEPTTDKVKNNPIVYSGHGKPCKVLYMSPHLDNVYLCY